MLEFILALNLVITVPCAVFAWTWWNGRLYTKRPADSLRRRLAHKSRQP